MRPAASIGLAGALALTPLGGGTARAHGPDTTRTVRGSARVSTSGAVALDLLVDQRLPRGAARLQRARFDVDRDGRLSDAEARLLGTEVAPLVVGGLTLHAGPTPLSPTTQDATARSEGRDALRVAVLLRFSLPSLPPEGVTLTVAPDARGGLEPVRVALAPIEAGDAGPATAPPVPTQVRPGDPPTPWPAAPRQR